MNYKLLLTTIITLALVGLMVGSIFAMPINDADNDNGTTIHTITPENFKSDTTLELHVGDTLIINGYENEEDVCALMDMYGPPVVPGMTFESAREGFANVYFGEGTLTTEGTYVLKTVYTEDEEFIGTLTLEVAEKNWEVTFRCNSEHGSLEHEPMEIPNGTHYIVDADGNLMFMGVDVINPREDIGYKPYWITDGIRVTEGIITADTLFTCEFEIELFDITFETLNPDETHGSIDTPMVKVPFGTQWRIDGNNIIIGNDTIRATADDGYVVKWLIDGKEATDGLVRDPLEFKAEFNLTYWTVDFTHSEGGKLLIDGSENVTSINFIAWGTEINVNDDGTMSIGEHTIVPVSDIGYVFSDFSVESGSITADREINANFVKSDVVVVITITVDEHGTIIVDGTPSEEKTIKFEVPKDMAIQVIGGQLKINGIKYTISADDGYDFDYWETPRKATEDTTITGHILTTEYGYVSIGFIDTIGGKVTVVQYNEKSIVAKGSLITVNGNTITVGTFVFTADASDGYAFMKWCYRNGEEIKDGDPAISDITVIAVFEENVEPEPEEQKDNTGFMLGVIISASVGIIALIGIMAGFRHPLVYIILAVSVIAAIVLALFYTGTFKL